MNLTWIAGIATAGWQGLAVLRNPGADQEFRSSLANPGHYPKAANSGA